MLLLSLSHCAAQAVELLQGLSEEDFPPPSDDVVFSIFPPFSSRHREWLAEVQKFRVQASSLKERAAGARRAVIEVKKINRFLTAFAPCTVADLGQRSTPFPTQIIVFFLKHFVFIVLFRHLSLPPRRWPTTRSE